MATIEDVKERIQSANVLGRTNLAEKGVELPDTATTYDIMEGIAEVSGGGGTEYTNIVYNEEDIITLTDKDGIDHKMVCTYDDAGKLVAVSYDGKSVELTYEGDNLICVGGAEFDLSGTKIKHELETSNTGDNVSSSVGTKSNDGMAIYGIGYDKASTGSTFYSGYLISREESAVLTSKITRAYTITYNDVTWYYGTHRSTNSKSTYQDGVVTPYDAGKLDGTKAVVSILDYYFGVGEAVGTDLQNGYALGLSSGGVVEVVDTTEIDNLETLIDNSGVLGSTEGTATKKVEQLIDKASDESKWYEFIEKLNQTVNNAFVNCTFETLPKMNPINIPKMPYWFQGNKYLKKIDFYFNSSKCTEFGRTFLDCSSLESIVGIDTSKATTVQAMFTRCSALHTIGEIVNGKLINPLDFSSVSINTQCFDGCTSLINISFVAESIKKSLSIPSPVLSADSIQSIIDGLATVTTAQTLTLHADVKAKLTQTQLDTITSKNWNLA